MEPTEPLPAKRARKPINYRDMEDDFDEAIRESLKPKKAFSKKSSEPRRRPVAPVPEDFDPLEGLGLEDDEDLDALNEDQLRAEIEKVKAQIAQFEEDLQRDPEVSISAPPLLTMFD